MTRKRDIPKVLILEWCPAISSYKIDHFEEELVHFDEAWFNWSVWNWKQVREGDEFFMIKCGEGVTGIVMHGVLSSDPYPDEDWSGKGRKVYYADMKPDTMIHPDKCRLLTTGALGAAMPDFQWNGGHSGRMLPKEYTGKLHEMWNEYLAMNDDFLDEKRAARWRRWLIDCSQGKEKVKQLESITKETALQSCNLGYEFVSPL